MCYVTCLEEAMEAWDSGLIYVDNPGNAFLLELSGCSMPYSGAGLGRAECWSMALMLGLGGECILGG